MTFILPGDCWLGVSVTAIDEVSLKQQLAAIKRLKLSHPLLVEWRLDYWRDWQLASLKSANQMIRQQLSSHPLLLTLRTTVEGGQLTLNRSTYTKRLLQIGQELTWDLLDVMPEQIATTINRREQLGQSANQQLIFSQHRLQPTTFKMNVQQLSKLAQYAGSNDVIKLAVQANSMQNSLDLLNATLLMSKKLQQPVMTMGMGTVGQITRELGPLFGSTLSFGALMGVGSAPGQLPVQQLDQLLV